MLRKALAATAACLICATVSADDWPQWHGINRDSHSAETGWLDKWPPEPVWTNDINEGFSSCAVTNGRLYTMGWITGAGFSNIVYCLDALTGTQIWSFAYDCGMIDYNGPRATPTVSGNRVYTFSQHGDLHCLDATTGTNIWNATYAKGKPTWGFASSVLLEGDLAIINSGYRGTAVNRWTGAFVWGNANASANNAGSSSAQAISWNSQRIILLFTGHSLEGLNATNGTRVFYYNRNNDQYAVADPIMYGNTVFIANGRQGYCACLNMVSNAMTHAWGSEQSHFNQMYNSAVLVDGYLYGTAWASQSLRCVRPSDGAVMWSEPGFTSANQYNESSLTYADGKLFVLKWGGDLHVIRATPERFDNEGRAPYSVDFNNQNEWCAPPVLANGLLYCRQHNGALVCLRLQGSPTSNDGDTLPDTWEQQCFTNHTDVLPDGDEDGDGCSNEGEYVAGTDPTNAASRLELRITVSNSSVYVSTPTVPLHGIGYDESLGRYYDLFCRTNLSVGSWTGIPTHTNVTGTGAVLEYTVPGGKACEHYRLRTRLE